jgi:hypothetical protein
MENKQQTAVEWLENELDNILYLDLFHSEWKKVTKAIEQAKAMEKQQILQSYNQGYRNGTIDERNTFPIHRER